MTLTVDGRAPRVARWSLAVNVVCACAVFLFTGLYRFNTLGGTYGGFENDHFVPFAYAKQVQAGDQPLRDFSGLGLQGAWPSLTYEVSVWGQEWFGNNLRSEAIVTITAVALAAALTFAAASMLSNAFWGVLATAVSVFVAPTLYNYSKVLVLSAVAVMIVAYARRPTTRRVVGGAVLTAVAFLFRHDYAVLAGVGILLGYAAAGDRARALRHGAIYVGLTALLLMPSLAYVQYHAGLFRYVRDSIVVSQREAERTGLAAWPAFTMTSESGQPVSAASFFDVEQNGVTWLYYVMRLLPFAAAAMVWKAGIGTERPSVRAAALAIAGMSAFAVPFWLRGSVAVRLGDLGPLFSTLLAIVCSQTFRVSAGTRAWGRSVVAVIMLVVLGATALSATTVGYVRTQLNTSGLARSWAATRERTDELSKALATLPDAALVEGNTPFRIARYVNTCTQPSDRIVMMSYQPETLPYARRLFGAGRLSVIPKYILGPENEAELVGFWQRQSVPLVLVEFDEFLTTTGHDFPVVRRYLREHYHEDGSIGLSTSRTLHVFATNDRAPLSTFGDERLPCFR